MRMTFANGVDKCECYSQQGTNLRLSYRACIDVLQNGWFDFSKPDTEIEYAKAETNDGPPAIHTQAGAATGPSGAAPAAR